MSNKLIMLQKKICIFVTCWTMIKYKSVKIVHVNDSGNSLEIL